jgi:tetratricopeptide (TPR) repeat protein
MSDRSVDSAWEQLRRHLDWVKDPWVGFVCASGGRLSGELAERARVHLEQSGRKLRVHKPASAEALRSVAVELLDEPADASTCVWLEGVRFGASASGEDPWENAWLWLLQRLNEHRERILRTLQGGLVLALPRPMKSEVAATAPDLWSVRALSLDVDETKAWIGPPSPLAPAGFPEERTVDLDLARTDVASLSKRVRELERDAEASPQEKLAARMSLATAESELAVALAQRGEFDAALQPCTKAVDELRKLASSAKLANTTNVWANLAAALQTLANLHDGLGQLDVAADMIEESVDILRKLANADPATFRSRFALGLSQLLLLHLLTRRDDGSAVLQEWLELPWEVVATSDDGAPGVAKVLTYLSGAFAVLADPARVLRLTKVVTARYRHLVEHHPGCFEGGLAVILDVLGERLAGEGYAEEALDVLKEVVALHRRLGPMDLPAYEVALAGRLHRLANAHRALGQDAEALAVDQEAEALRATDRLAAMLGKLDHGED